VQKNKGLKYYGGTNYSDDDVLNDVGGRETERGHPAARAPIINFLKVCSIGEQLDGINLYQVTIQTSKLTENRPAQSASATSTMKSSPVIND